MEHQEEKQQPFLYRFLVGILIGSGFIVPGVSGGRLLLSLESMNALLVSWPT